MPPKNNILSGILIVEKVALNYNTSTSSRIKSLNQNIRNKNENLILKKNSYFERKKGPVWAQFPVVKNIWETGCGKLWNRDLKFLYNEIEKETKEVRQFKNILNVEKQKLSRLSSLLEKIKKAKTDKVVSHIISEEDQRRLAFITGKISRNPIVNETIINETIIAIGKLLNEIKKRPGVKVPNILRTQQKTSAPVAANFLPYRTSYHEPIYLPIPKDLGYLVKKLGAVYDGNVRKGGRYFIPPNTDLKPFDRYLPLAFRERPLQLDFYPSEPKTAEKVNLRTIFDAETWDYIRTTNYSKTNNRCVVCGKKSGDLLDRMAPEVSKNRYESVECHEVWEFNQPNDKYSIGIQKLKALYIVCFKCHMTFHDKIARSMLNDNENILLFAQDLHAHRSHITRQDQATVYNEMVKLNTESKAMNKIDHWIIDLEHLTNQDYMRNVSPIFLDYNKAGVSVDQIAGFEFSTDSGERMPIRTKEEIFKQIAPRYPIISVESLMSNMRM